MKKKKTSRKRHLPIILFGFSSALFLVTLASFIYLLHKNNLLPGTVHASTNYTSYRVFDGGVDDPGANYNESWLTTSNVSKLKVLWKANLPEVADNSVIEEAGVSTSSGYKNMVFVNTIKGNLIAYDALTGAKIWEKDPSSADFNGQGTKSSPAIDSSGNYIYAYAVDGYIHKYKVATGTEVTGGGFPAQVTRLPNDTEKGSASLNVANNYLYMTTSGNDGDYGHYVGHVVAINLSSGAKTVWNAECSNIAALLYTSGSDYCSNTMSGIWARPGVKVDPVTGNVYVATGNGNYNANGGGYNWGDSIIELKSNLSSVVDSYTPTTYASLDSSDADLGSTAPVILPKQSSSNTPYMLVQAGKDHILRLLNRSNLSGAGGPRHTGGELQTITLSDEVHEQPAVWVDSSGVTWVFVTDDEGVLYAYKVTTTGGTSKLSQVYSESIGTSSSPFVANGIVYLDGGSILAINAKTGDILFDSSSIGVSINQHWEAPTVVNGMVYTTDYSGHLYALYVSGVTPTSAPTSSGSSSSGTSSGATAKPTSSGGQSSGSSSATSSPSANKKATAKTSKPGSQSKTLHSGTSANSASQTGSSANAAKPKSSSLASRIKQPVFVASASGAVVAAGVAVKLFLLHGTTGSMLPGQTVVPANIADKIRLLLAKILRRP